MKKIFLTLLISFLSLSIFASDNDLLSTYNYYKDTQTKLKTLSEQTKLKTLSESKDTQTKLKTLSESKRLINGVINYNVYFKPNIFVFAAYADPNTFVWYIWNDFSSSTGFNKLTNFYILKQTYGE